MSGRFSLNGAPVGRWVLEHGGRRLEAETGRAGWRRTVRLRVDGAAAGEAAGFNAVTVPFGDAAVRAVFDVPGLVDGQAARCELVPHGPDAADGADARGGGEPGDEGPRGAEPGEDGRAAVPFTPPEGSRAARREALARARPVLYASRHVVSAVGGVLFPLLGLGVLVRTLVEKVPWPRVDVSLPSLDPPDLPDLPGIPWPDVDLPDVSAPWWVQAVLASAKFWVPVLIAVGAAAREVSRRRRRRAGEDAGREDGAGAAPSGGRGDERVRPS